MCSYNRMKLNLFYNHLLSSYNATDIIDKLNMSVEDLLPYIEDYLMDNLIYFKDDLITL